MKTPMTRLLFACLLFGLLASAPLLYAQDADPGATVVPAAEATAEETVEAIPPEMEEAETNSAIGDPPITTGEQPGGITSGSTIMTPQSPVAGTIDENPEAGAIISAPVGEPPIALDVGEEGLGEDEAEGAVVLEGEAAEAELAEAPQAEGEQAPGATVLVLLLGLGAVFAVGLLTLARDQFGRNRSDDDTTPQ